MKKNSKSGKKGAVPKIDPYLEGFMSKLLERLTGLERKMDSVISRLAAKPSGKGDATQSFQSPQPSEPPRRDRILFEAICAECSKVCEVPFKPSEGRAVYCKPCFAKRKAGGTGISNTIPRPVALAPRPATFQQTAAVAVKQAPKKSKKKK